ncbi:N-(5'-phosphoribosyl)anthranilate isomerase [Fuscibacter oryzae]|uniref:N-(5'-phosphoribosyl)anthranilate isomerase n=1 Tax=Fuscibacter oryzae TaxID=2803939 RepID=A0A8J7MP75_9RHOB|nr:N-(5'-phosphoribosyl)anthranilate isomerase [Fuscibacter oryzae]MBL4927446.1 N-(5'-phosphoribosyl)anthranilate isomerase [Fuscibacter oryzae]
MQPMTNHMSPDRWVAQMFSARTAAEGGIVRRRVSDVERLIGRDRFVKKIARRGYRAVENSGHFVIFCNAGPVRIVV